MEHALLPMPNTQTACVLTTAERTNVVRLASKTLALAGKFSQSYKREVFFDCLLELYLLLSSLSIPVMKLM